MGGSWICRGCGVGYLHAAKLANQTNHVAGADIFSNEYRGVIGCGGFLCARAEIMEAYTGPDEAGGLALLAGISKELFITLHNPGSGIIVDHEVAGGSSHVAAQVRVM